MSTGTENKSDQHVGEAAEQSKLLARLIDEVRGLRGDLKALTSASLDAELAADYLSISRRTLDRYVEQGRIFPIDMSTNPDGRKRGRVTFTRDELHRFRKENQLCSDLPVQRFVQHTSSKPDKF